MIVIMHEIAQRSVHYYYAKYGKDEFTCIAG